MTPQTKLDESAGEGKQFFYNQPQQDFSQNFLEGTRNFFPPKTLDKTNETGDRLAGRLRFYIDDIRNLLVIIVA